MQLHEAHPIRRDLPVILFLILATALVYGQIGNFDFVLWDDHEYVYENAIVQKGLTWQNIQWAFTTTTQANWHPLTWLSHMADCQIFGLKPGAHHLVNLFFHLVNSILLFLVLQRMTGAHWRSAIVAALFALHPLHVESVAWISERKDVLSSFFWMLSMAAYTRYAEKVCLKRYLLVLLFFIPGLLAKPMLVTLPLIFLTMDYWPLGRIRFGEPVQLEPSKPAEPAEPGRKGRKKRKGAPGNKRQTEARLKSFDLRLAVEKIPLIVLSAVMSLIAYLAQQKEGAVAPLQAVPLFERISNACVSYVIYLWKMIWPAGLVFFYPRQSWSFMAISASVLFLVGVTFLSLRFARRFPYLLFGWLWYLVTLLPVIGLVQIGDAAMADRYTYIPLIGPFIALVWAAHDLSARLPYRRIALSVLAAAVLSACMVLTFIQVGQWQNTVSLFAQGLKTTPGSYRIYNMLGEWYMKEGRPEEALARFEKAVELNPLSSSALYKIGKILLSQGRTEEAMERFSKIASPADYFARSQYELGSIYLSRGDADKAIDYFERGIRTGKLYPQLCARMADALLMKGRLDEALQYTLRALERQADDAKLHYNAGNLLIGKGRVSEAIAHFREAVRLSPDYSRAHNNLGSALLLEGRTDEAVQQFQEAIRIDPNYEMARANLRDALAQQGKNREHPQKGTR
jgi:protein O-mannosyl-transferase